MMNFWRLASPDQFSEPSLMAQHSLWLCLAAVVMAVLAAWVLLPVKDRFHASKGRTRLLWWLAGSVAMGTGIWAMHFTAMLAFSLPVPIRYDVGITLFSMIPGIIANGLVIQLFVPEKHSKKRLNLMALIMAFGIGSMHYIGMEAIVVPATMYYVPQYFLLSIAAGYLLALLGLYTYKQLLDSTSFPRALGKLLGSIMLGLAASGMHFIAMAATYFQPQFGGELTDFSMPPYDLVIGIIAISIVLIGMVIIGSIVDRRLETMSHSLEQSELRFRRLAETTHTAIFTFKDDIITYANPALGMITGYENSRILGARLPEIFCEDFSDFAKMLLESDLNQGQAIHKNLEFHAADGPNGWLHFSLTMMEFDGETVGLASAFDISEQKNAELTMRKLAYNDQLTQIGNRMMFMDRLEHHLEFLKRRDSSFTSCVMLLDLDKFKSINDTYGHLAGDELLISVAKRLTHVARKVDTVARLGGDEFVFLLEEMNNSYSASIVADRITEVLSEPHELLGRQLVVKSSIGVVELSGEYETPDQALHDADIALYRAKKDPTTQWVLFDQALDARVKRSRVLLSELKQAVAERTLQLYYQPIVESDSYELRGFEALARWQRACGEWVAPDEFIPLAEDTGLVADLGIWALETACAQLSIWNREVDHHRLYVSVNIAPVSFNEDRFVHKVAEMFEQYGFAPAQLKLELTERMLVGDLDTVLDKLNALIKLGCELMIDDFGTGYSSLSYLHRLPIRTVKIDRSFVSNLDNDESSVPIVKTITALAESLNMNVVSEGVETESQARKLAKLGSDQLQGYWFARPMPGEESIAYLLNESVSAHSKVVTAILGA